MINGKSIAVMQPYIFPYMGYFQLINSVDDFVFFDDVNYINKGWINRNSILVNNKPTMFTIPLKDASQNSLINEIQLSDYDKWKVKFIRTLEMAYSKAPCFKLRIDFLRAFLNRNFTDISDFSASSSIAISKLLGFKTDFSFSSKLNTPSNINGGQNKILHICKVMNAGKYINPYNGKHLYEEKAFGDNGIELRFIKMGDVKYKQFNNADFFPSLSIIDVLMFNTDDEIRELLLKFELS